MNLFKSLFVCCFVVAMCAIAQPFAYKSIDAATYQPKLTTKDGKVSYQGHLKYELVKAKPATFAELKTLCEQTLTNLQFAGDKDVEISRVVYLTPYFANEGFALVKGKHPQEVHYITQKGSQIKMTVGEKAAQIMNDFVPLKFYQNDETFKRIVVYICKISPQLNDAKAKEYLQILNRYASMNLTNEKKRTTFEPLVAQIRTLLATY